jgi:hypothetical protein
MRCCSRCWREIEAALDKGRSRWSRETASLRSRGGLRSLRTLVSRARRVGRALQRQRVAAVEAVRHFLGFAEDSDARVVKNCVLAQIGYGRRAAAEDDCRRVRLPTGARLCQAWLWRARGRAALAQIIVGALPLRVIAAGCGCCPDEAGQQTRSRGGVDGPSCDDEPQLWEAGRRRLVLGRLGVSATTQTGATMPSSPGMKQTRRRDCASTLRGCKLRLRECVCVVRRVPRSSTTPSKREQPAPVTRNLARQGARRTLAPTSFHESRSSQAKTTDAEGKEVVRRACYVEAGAPIEAIGRLVW